MISAEEQPVDWIARLGGDKWSLEGLCGAFQTGATRVRQDDDGCYYLSSPSLTSCADADAAWREAERLVSRINDAAVALDRGHQPVEAHAVVCISEDGTRRASVRASLRLSVVARARVSATVTRADSTIDPPGPSHLERLCAALEREGTDGDLARALRAWRSGELDEGLLFHVYEIIKHEVSGGTDRWETLQAVTPAGMTWDEFKDELRRFRGTVNDPAHAGSSARHGQPMRKSISDPMQLKEAEDLIWRLLQRWIETKV
jgi:hypothetical protein